MTQAMYDSQQAKAELQRSLEFSQTKTADLKAGMPTALFVADTDAAFQGMLTRIRQLEDSILLCRKAR